jgi:hypothetical protein
LEAAPTVSVNAVGLSRSIILSTTEDMTNGTEIFPNKTVLPITRSFTAKSTAKQGYFKLFAGVNESNPNTIALGEVVFDTASATTEQPIEVSVIVTVSVDSSLQIDVESESKKIASLLIPGVTTA